MNNELIKELLAKHQKRKLIYGILMGAMIVLAPFFISAYIFHRTHEEIMTFLEKSVAEVICGGASIISFVSLIAFACLFIATMSMKKSKLYATVIYQDHEVTVFQFVEGLRRFLIDGKDVTKEIKYKPDIDNMVGFYEFNAALAFKFYQGKKISVIDNNKEIPLN